jgi:beta-carotene 3-hydroxylase
MNWLIGPAVFAATLAGMEVFAYVAHRWMMHGFLWSLHKSHHEPRLGRFEKNDWFAVIFAGPAIALIAWGSYGGPPRLVWAGAGITAYGAIYAGFHDVLVHRRVRHGWNPRSRYLKRIMQAHRLHHVVESKHGTVSFGFLWAPPVRALLADLEARGVGKVRAARPTESSKVHREMDRDAATISRG